MIHVDCPKHPEHRQFTVTVIMAQQWLADAQGTLIRPMGEPLVYNNPRVRDDWACCDCKIDADATEEE